MRIRPLYFIGEALASFRKNWVMSIAAVSTVALTLFIIGMFTIVAFILSSVIKIQESKVEIVAFLKDSAKPEDIQSTQNELVSWPEVANVRYISKEQALERLKEELKGQPEMLDAMSGNPLPASLEISLKNPRAVKTVAKRLDGRAAIEEIKYGEGVVEKLFVVTKVIRWAGVIFAFLLCFASLVLIVNTIRLAIFARRKEVAIMKLVGASNWFVRWPFILEGILQGLIGSLLAIGVLYLIKVFSLESVMQFFRWLRVPLNYPQLTQQFYLLLGYLILAGAVIGALGSAVALRRYLRV
ncbi:MAG TPA: cell division protein FtsX [Actinobacteria bacterium]|nr:cell division protein FtsX [Actinomycetota bacterium]